LPRIGDVTAARIEQGEVDPKCCGVGLLVELRQDELALTVVDERDRMRVLRLAESVGAELPFAERGRRLQREVAVVGFGIDEAGVATIELAGPGTICAGIPASGAGSVIKFGMQAAATPQMAIAKKAAA